MTQWLLGGLAVVAVLWCVLPSLEDKAMLDALIGPVLLMLALGGLLYWLTRHETR